MGAFYHELFGSAITYWTLKQKKFRRQGECDPAIRQPLRLLRGSVVLGYVCAAMKLGTMEVASSRMKPRVLRIEITPGG